MRLALMPITLLVAAALAAPAAIAAPTGSAMPQTRASAAKLVALGAKVEACSIAPAARFAVFKGTMPSIKAGGRMEMRFGLYQSVDGQRTWRHVQNVDTFDEWDLSDVGVSGFIVKKRVGNLAPATLYRTVVSFRWRDAAGRITRRAKRISAPCAQPDTRPDLVVRGFAASAGRRADGVATYSAVVANRGNGPAAAFNVAITVGGVVGAPVRVGPLAAGQRTPVTFSAPKCAAGSAVQLTADSSAEVAEVNEANNVLSHACPFGG